MYEKAGDFEVLDIDCDRVYWQILHAECDTDAKPTDYRLPGHLFSTTGDLLEATAYLLRNQPDLVIGSNWHGLIGRILADTREYADWLQSPKHIEQKAAARRRTEARRKRQLTDPNDPATAPTTAKRTLIAGASGAKPLAPKRLDVSARTAQIETDTTAQNTTAQIN